MSRLIFRFASIDLSQIIRYYAVGALVNVGGYALFLLLLKVGIEPKLAASLLYILGMVVSFFLNRKLVFNSAVTLKSGLNRLIWMSLAGYALNICMLYIFVDQYKINPKIIQILAIILVSVFFYIVNKLFVHKAHHI